MNSRRRSRFRLEVSRDQARAFVKAEIGPGPLKEHRNTIPKSDQENDVNEQPGEPRGKSADVHEVQIGDGFVSSNRGHAALVPIPEALRPAPFNHRQNIARGIATLLHRNQLYTR